MTTEEFHIGKKTIIGIAEETGDYGQGGDMDTDGEVLGYNALIQPGDWSRGWTEILSAGSSSRKVDNKVVGRKDLPHALQFNPASWRFLKYIFQVTGESGTNPTTHTMAVSNTLNTYELEWRTEHTTNPLQIRLGGGYVKTARISFSKQTGAGEGSIQADLTCNAQDTLTFGTPSSLGELSRSSVELA